MVLSGLITIDAIVDQGKESDQSKNGYDYFTIR